MLRLRPIAHSDSDLELRSTWMGRRPGGLGDRGGHLARGENLRQDEPRS